nr:ATP-grasp domain-containing protein [Lautropia sp.]
MAWRLAQSRGMEVVFIAPGNAGTALEERIRNIPLTRMDSLAQFAEREKVDFTLVGPEAPLADGVVDFFRERGLPIFGPTQAAAQLESSKDFSKSFMRRHAIPTASYRSFTDPVDAKAYISGRGAPIVVKADGLAAGKGVVVAETVAQAHAAVDRMLGGEGAGARVVVEEFLEGEEASFIVMVDGRHVLPLA